MSRKLHLNSRFPQFRLSACLLSGLLTLTAGTAFGATESAGSMSHSTQSQIDFDSNTPIPHSTVAVDGGAGIVKAMLSCATSRYAHGVLGDAIEGGCLVVEDDRGAVYQLDLPEHQVFEDLIPRIADIDGDKRNDVVLVRSDSRGGAALSIYTLAQDNDGTNLQELASTPPIGTANRWLAPVGIADFNNDGAVDIAYIQTPHIGGILKVWTLDNGKLTQIAQSRGYSNHSIGDTRVSTAKVEDYNNDGVMDMALPDQRRRNTLWVTLSPELAVIDTKSYSLDYFD